MKVLSSVITATVVAKASALSHDEKLRLLRKAVPLSSRKLNNNQNAYAIAADESIEFNACVSLTALPENQDQEFIASSDEMKTLFEQGDIVSQTSVVLFGICTTGNCTGSEANLYVTDLGSYMQLAGYRPQKTFDYCDACVNAQNYCDALAAGDDGAQANAQADDKAAANANNADDKAAANADDANANANAQNGGRNLAKAQYVNCTTCASLGCFDNQQQNGNNNNNNNNGQQQLTLEGMVQWVEQQGQCQATGQYWNNMELYSSFMCNQEGTGVELALFLDDNCQLYTASTSYSSIFPDDQYVSNSQNVVTYPFTNDIDCAADTVWESPEQQGNGDDAAAQQDDGQQNANAYCQALMNDGDILELNNCYANGNNANNNNNNNNNQNNGDYYDYFSQWTYNLNGREDINNPAARCTALKNMQGDYVSFKTTKKTYNVYKKDTSHSGQNYSYKRASSKSSLSGGAIAGIVIAVLVALGVGLVVARMYKKKKDSKREPLVAADGIGA